MVSKTVSRYSVLMKTGLCSCNICNESEFELKYIALKFYTVEISIEHVILSCIIVLIHITHKDDMQTILSDTEGIQTVILHSCIGSSIQITELCHHTV